MPLITSKAVLAKAKEICHVAKGERRLIRGDKRVTQAIQKLDPPVTLLIVAADGGCANHVAKATEHNLPILKLPTRSEVGEIVGYASDSACVLSFVGDQELLAQLLQLG